MAIKWRLAVLLADREMNYKELAKLMGVHPNTANKLKNHIPERLTPETLEKLCDALDCQPGDLLVRVKD